MVRIHPDPPTDARHRKRIGAIAQLGERLLCKQEVTGSIPVGSTSAWLFERRPPKWKRGFFHFEVRFIRLLFNNSEEVKRIRFFSEPGSSGYEIALEVMVSRLSRPRRRQALSMILCMAPSCAQGYRVK